MSYYSQIREKHLAKAKAFHKDPIRYLCFENGLFIGKKSSRPINFLLNACLLSYSYLYGCVLGLLRVILYKQNGFHRYGSKPFFISVANKNWYKG